jgi:uncharacterized membrane protein
MLLEEWVALGGHVHMMGDWYSFSGEIGKVLPVICLDGDDLVESTSSFPVSMQNHNHPVLAGITLDEIPPLPGFNETILREGCISLLDIQYMGNWYPLLAARVFGKGKVSAFYDQC